MTRWRELLTPEDDTSDSPVPDILRALTRAMTILERHRLREKYAQRLTGHEGELPEAVSEELAAAAEVTAEQLQLAKVGACYLPVFSAIADVLPTHLS